MNFGKKNRKENDNTLLSQSILTRLFHKEKSGLGQQTISQVESRQKEENNKKVMHEKLLHLRPGFWFSEAR